MAKLCQKDMGYEKELSGARYLQDFAQPARSGPVLASAWTGSPGDIGTNDKRGGQALLF
jgi:hypothetical protein